MRLEWKLQQRHAWASDADAEGEAYELASVSGYFRAAELRRRDRSRKPSL
jgi:hypothetical protein